MNERIKLLAEESGAWEYFNEGNEKSAVMDSKALSNFAELIVKECVEQIIIRERTDGEWYQDDIFKHFGVKE